MPVVLVDPRLNLADEIGADVGGLGVDAAGDAREERDGRSAEAESGEVPQRRVNLSVRHAHQHEEDDFYSREAEADDLSKPYA